MLFGSLRADAAVTSIVPDVGAVATGGLKPEGVGVRCCSNFEGEHKLMFGPVECAHPAVRLVPDAELLLLGKRCLPGSKQWSNAAPGLR